MTLTRKHHKNARISNKSVWTHKAKGGEFCVLGAVIGAGQLNGESLIVYKDRKKDLTFAIREDEWHSTMERVV